MSATGDLLDYISALGITAEQKQRLCELIAGLRAEDRLFADLVRRLGDPAAPR